MHAAADGIGTLNINSSWSLMTDQQLLGLDKLFLFFYLLFYSLKKFSRYSFQVTHYSFFFPTSLIIPKF